MTLSEMVEKLRAESTKLDEMIDRNQPRSSGEYARLEDRKAHTLRFATALEEIDRRLTVLEAR